MSNIFEKLFYTIDLKKMKYLKKEIKEKANNFIYYSFSEEEGVFL